MSVGCTKHNLKWTVFLNVVIMIWHYDKDKAVREGNTQNIDWPPSQSASNAKLWCFYCCCLLKMLNKQSSRWCHIHIGLINVVSCTWVACSCNPPRQTGQHRGLVRSHVNTKNIVTLWFLPHCSPVQTQTSYRNPWIDYISDEITS